MKSLLQTFITGGAVIVLGARCIVALICVAIVVGLVALEDRWKKRKGLLP